MEQLAFSPCNYFIKFKNQILTRPLITVETNPKDVDRSNTLVTEESDLETLFISCLLEDFEMSYVRCSMPELLRCKSWPLMGPENQFKESKTADASKGLNAPGMQESYAFVYFEK